MNKIIKITVLSIGHLLIDLEGIYLINKQFNDYDFKYIAFFFIIYNVIAFGLQPFFGYFADTKNKYLHFVIIGSILPIVAIFIKDVGIVAIIISTVGNAMYHIGGGVISVNLYPNKAAPAGIFVAPGVIGVFLGIFLASRAFSYEYVIAVIGIIVIVLIFIIFRGFELKSEYKKINQNFVKIIILILLIVAIRGFIGSMLMFTWKDNTVYDILLVAAIFLGKFFGGILGDKFGFKEVGIFGLIVSAPLLLLGYYWSIAGLIGALFFNFTMAITLFLIIDNLGKYKGFAFGLTTLTLVIAFLPKALGISISFGFTYYSTILILVVLGSYILYRVVSLDEKNNKLREC
ncbi:MAG: hypothetical protein DRP93_07650 [Candidatus Neomarinimicrobiota bacterium]|nr:MAG: hypothetical protein DRP93_07650 [Candidatus Neomarinimicrobiota bacterium]